MKSSTVASQSPSAISPGTLTSQIIASVDFGVFTSGRKPLQHTRRITISSGKKANVSAVDTWVNVQPDTISGAGWEIFITINPIYYTQIIA